MTIVYRNVWATLLEELNLWDNKLKSPFSNFIAFSKMQSLKKLDLSLDNLFADIDSLRGFCEIRTLQVLNVESNSYVGSIPQCFGNMNSLRSLHLSYNQFTGTIPSSIFQNLTKLMFISASHNQFNDSISFSTFANLSKLIEIDLSDNA